MKVEIQPFRRLNLTVSVWLEAFLIIIELSHKILWEEFRIKTNHKGRPRIAAFQYHSSKDHVPSNLLFLMVNLLALQVSQTTIPYIDSQPVAPQVGSWLSGVGLYHKGTSGSGGYVGAMIKTYDISRHLVSKKRDEQKETYILSK